MKRNSRASPCFKRSFENIIQNGLTYGNKVNVNVQKGNNRALILIEDDGPGIPEDQYKNVFKPKRYVFTEGFRTHRWTLFECFLKLLHVHSRF